MNFIQSLLAPFRAGQMGGGYQGQIPGIGGQPPSWRTPGINGNAPMPGMGMGGPLLSAVTQRQQMAPAPQSARPGPAWVQKFAGGLERVMDGMTGPVNPMLDPQQQQAVQQQQRFALISSLLRSSRPVPQGTSSILAPFGDAMAASQQAGQVATADLFQSDLIRRQLAEADRLAKEQSSLESLIRSNPSLSQQEKEYLSTAAQSDRPFALREFGKMTGILAQAEEKPRRIGESPAGKLFADLQVAEASGNTAAVEALEFAIQQEIGKGEKAPEINFDDMRAMRNDVKRDSGDFLQRQSGYQNVLAAANDPSPASDLALLFGVMKVLDPGSIVREGEVQLTESAGDLAQRTAVVFKRVFQGERLTGGQRDDFVKMARGQYEVSRKQHDRLLEDARGFAKRHGLAIEDVVPEFVNPTDFGDTGVPEFDYDPATGQLIPRRR